MLRPVVIARSGTIASGQVGWPHIASGAIRSGDLGITAGTPNGTLFLRDDFAWATPTVGSGAIGSGKIASGAVQGFFGTTPDIASGTVGVWDLGSGAVIAGAMGSGSVVSGNIASGQVGTFALRSGIITSGFWVASGSIFGQAGPNQFCIASGTITTNDLGSGTVVSGLIASGQVGNFAISSGAVTSGRLGVAGAPTGTKFLRDDFNWAVPIIASGTVGSGGIASGAVQGFFGTTPDIASGTVGVFDFGSGAVIAGAIGSGAVQGANLSSGVVTTLKIAPNTTQSGHYLSGSVGTYHLASGTIVDVAQASVQFASGIGRMTAITEEAVSGVRTVCLSQSGNIRVAMASVSGRMPAIGVVVDNVASGIQVNVYNDGNFQLSSGLADYSGYLGKTLYVGRSGQLVTASGSFNSGGFLSGDLWQSIGVALNSGAIETDFSVQLPFLLVNYLTSGQIGSGSVTGQAGGGYFCIASGTESTYDHSSGCVVRAAQFVTPIQSGTNWALLTREAISGVRAVAISQSGTLWIAMAAVSGRMPAVGVVVDNVTSGINANVYTDGFFQLSSGMADYSGYLGDEVWVGRSGQVVTVSGSWASGGFGSGDIGQKLGTALNSGAPLLRVNNTVWSGGPMGEGTGGLL